MHTLLSFISPLVEILVAPVGKVAVLNSTTTFYCEAIANFGVHWSVDGVQDHHPAIEARGIIPEFSPQDPVTGILNSTLTVPATMENNGTKIQCVAVDPAVVRSPEVTLLIQGMNNCLNSLQLYIVMALGWSILGCLYMEGSVINYT